MTVQTGLVELLTLHSPGTPDAKELIEALDDFAKSRATRELIRSNVQRRIQCALRVPLLKDGHAVRPTELGRVLRKVIRSAVEASSPGDHVLVDFIVTADSRLEIKAGPATQMGGVDGAAIDRIFSP
jgi:signal transduction histidine kinase